MILNQKYLRAEIEWGLRKEFQQELANKRLAFDLLKVESDKKCKETLPREVIMTWVV